MNTATSWFSYVALRRVATAASAEVLGHTVVERPGLISTASPATRAPGGSIFVHGDPGDDEELRQFLRSVNPSYVEVARDTGNALATLRSEGCRPGHDLAVMAADTSSLSHDPLPTSVSPGRVAMAVPGHLADLSSLPGEGTSLTPEHVLACPHD